MKHHTRLDEDSNQYVFCSIQNSCKDNEMAKLIYIYMLDNTWSCVMNIYSPSLSRGF